MMMMMMMMKLLDQCLVSNTTMHQGGVKGMLSIDIDSKYPLSVVVGIVENRMGRGRIA